MNRLILFSTLILVICLSVQSQTNHKDYSNIEVIAFKYMINENNDYLKQNSIICTSIQDSTTDLNTSNVIKRLKCSDFKKYNIKSCTGLSDSMMFNNNSVLFTIRHVIIDKSTKKATVFCDAFIESLLGYDYKLTLTKKWRKWKIIKSEIVGTS